ncbi:MAG TPA: glycosyltransferase [Casimicrobiaceae bacterium]|nr:glycosyltransferase [Casimicrobiaceae bacterium]
MPVPIQMLWVEGRLSPLERLSMASFTQCGHAVHLYTYGQVDGVPEAVTVLDGRVILPEARICRYGPAAGRGEGSLALFANLFRYALLERLGGVWSDCDMVCLKPLDAALAADYLIATEYRDAARQIVLANNCLLKVPAKSPFIAECNAIAMSVDPEKSGWGELGPRMVTALVGKHELQRFLAPPWAFSPLGWWEFRRLAEDTPLEWPEGTLALHSFNEMWRRNGLDKHARYGAQSPFERLKARYLAGSEEEGTRAGADQAVRIAPADEPRDS